jgi:hypothetical protein
LIVWAAKVEVKMRRFPAYLPSLLLLTSSLALPVQAHPQAGDLPMVSVGGGAWGGYTLGYLQEVIYFSVPFDGFSGGGSADCKAFFLDIYGVRLGARAELGLNFSANSAASGLELDLAADAVIGFEYIRWLKPYIFGGIMANSFGASYDGGEWSSQTGLGLRYGGAVFFDVFEFKAFESMKAVVSVGAELILAHIFLMDPDYFLDVDIIYHTKQIRIPVRVSLAVLEGI